MKRMERQVTCPTEIESIIKRCPVIRLGMIDEGRPYIVPLNHGYRLNKDGSLSFFLHSAKEGRKIEILKRSPHVCFEMDCSVELHKDSIACKWTTYYESLMGNGMIFFLESASEKEDAMKTIMICNGYKGTLEFPSQIFDRMQIYRLDVTDYTAKRNSKKQL